MRFITWLISYLTFIIHINIVYSIDSQTSSNLSLISKMCVKIMKSCYAKSSKNIIFYGGANNDILQLFNQLNEPTSVSIQNKKISYIKFEKNSALFIIVTSSLYKLDSSLKNLKMNPYWNVNQPFFIMEETDNQNCDNVLHFLQESWRYNLLHVFFLCYQGGSVFIWTFNPFMINAPDSWIYHKTVSDNSSSEWTLYYQSYTTDFYQEMCKNLHWDKTARLNGFRIKIVGYPIFPSGIADVYKTEECEKDYQKTMMNQMLAYMNLSVLLHCIPTNKIGMIDTTGESTGLFKDIADGKYDILLNVFFGQYAKNIHMTQRNSMGSIKFAVLYKNNISTVEKIVRFLGYKLILATIIILLIIAMILKYYIKESYSSLFLELVRLLTDTAIRKLPKIFALRYFFGPVFLFFLLFQEIFQGNLSTLLTISIPEKNLETISDLKSHTDYKIYVSTALSSLVIDKKLQTRLIIVPEINCIKYVLNNTKAACIAPDVILINSPEAHELHFSTESFYTSFFFFLTRNDWPIQRKFRETLLKMIQSGHVYKTDKKYMETRIKVSRLSDVLGNTSFAPLRLDDLKFVFKGLLIGLCIASVLFVVEIKLKK